MVFIKFYESFPLWDIFKVLNILLISEFHHVPDQIMYQNKLKHSLLDPTPKVSDWDGLGRGLRICISNKLLDVARAADPGPPFGTSGLENKMVLDITIILVLKYAKI